MQPEKRHWLEWIEPWYLVYALMGLVVAGLLPVLIPLIVSQSGNAGQVGLVVAALSLGGLTSPLWGGLADRYRSHRSLLAGGMLFAGLGLAVFCIYQTARHLDPAGNHRRVSGPPAPPRLPTSSWWRPIRRRNGMSALAGCRLFMALARWPGCCWQGC